MAEYEDEWLKLFGGDCRDVMRDLPEGSVHTVITSPPYYNLRDYSTEGQIGQEATPEAYVQSLVEVFRSVWRVLRNDGTLWLNLGDSFAGKKLLGIPWRVAFALQDYGWSLRRDIIWSKPNPMPESVDDRPTSSHEYIFLLTKRANYFYDAFAVKEPISEAMASAIRRPRADRHDAGDGGWQRPDDGSISDSDSLTSLTLSRNRRSVWSIPTVSYPGAHYATFPPKLVEPMIQAGSSEHGVCAVCAAPYVRQTSTRRLDHHATTADGKTMDGPYANQAALRNGVYTDAESLGFASSCAHQAGVVPATVLDPFAGSGTVGMVANRLSRRAVLIDINPEYLRQQMERNAAIPLGL